MKMVSIDKGQWREVREIYLEAFPKSERKPFPVLRHSVKSGKAQLLTALEDGVVQGFVVVIPYQDMVMVDYLAVSGNIRSRGTGSRLMQAVRSRFPGKKLVLLIERPDERAGNREQRLARRRFYLKNGFTPSGIFITGFSGDMEILNYGGKVSPQAYMGLQRYALGGLMFWLSGIRQAA